MTKISKAIKKSKTCNIVIVNYKEGIIGWMESQGIEDNYKVILFKRVSNKFLTQENTINSTEWRIGKTVELKNWNPKLEECGEGKLHACSRPYFCDEFRDIEDDRYIAIEINKDDLYAWTNPEFPHKIAFRKGKVLYEVDKWGEKI